MKGNNSSFVHGKLQDQILLGFISAILDTSVIWASFLWLPTRAA